MAEPPARANTSEEINRVLFQHAKAGAKIEVDDVRGHPAVAAGLTARAELSIEGEAGDFLGAFNAGALLRTRGDVASCAGYGMLAGSIAVLGSAGDGAGAFLRGGELSVFGDVGAAAGWRMAGGVVAVKGDAGPRVGAGMAGGELAVLGRAGGPVGAGMSGGTIFVRQGSQVESAGVRVGALDAAAAARLREIAGRVNVTELRFAEFVKVTPAGAAPPPGAPPAPPEDEGRSAPRVRVAAPAPPGAARAGAGPPSDPAKGA